MGKNNEKEIKENGALLSYSSPPEIEQSEERKMLISMEEFAGPLPHPDIFKSYGDTVPDAPERILTVFEKDSNHTREMQKMALAGKIKKDIRSQWLGFLVVFLNIGVATASYIFTKSLLIQTIMSLSSVVVVIKVIFSTKGQEDEE